MKFYLETVIDRKDETVVAPVITEYVSQDEAERAYHKVLADNIDNDDIDFVRTKVINPHGGSIMNEYWQEYVPTPEPDPEDPEPTPVEPEAPEYYFTQIRFKNDGTTLRSITKYDEEDDALVAFHNLLYALMADTQYSAVTVLIEDKRGSEIKRRYWERS